MKSSSLAFLLLAASTFALPLYGGEIIKCKSPDGRFALRHVYRDQQPYDGNFAIIELRTKQVAAQLEPEGSTHSITNLVWSQDSQRVAYFREEQRAGTTRVFFRQESSFVEVRLPELPPIDPPTRGAPPAETRQRIEPLRWLNSGELLLENELQNPSWGRIAFELTIAFDRQGAASVRQAQPQEKSIVDYFLLLPPDTFEASAAAMLSLIRGQEVIDRKNGYIKCHGDGAQPDFEIALFRYRDGRPLLAICSGELEGNSSVYLEFFELGSDGEMQPVARNIFPFADAGIDDGRDKTADWKFELPRMGKTVLVKNRRTGKITHRVAWTGDKFQEKK